MTDTATIALADKDAPIRDTPPYDEDLLVQLLVEGTLSYRKIADRVGTSRTTVSNVSRGRSRPDLHERICQLVEDTHRRTRRQVAASLEAVYQKYLALALESEGETARKACEFILKTFANTPDPAGRYIAIQSPGGRSPGSPSRALTSPVTREELDLIAAVRNDANAPAFDELSKPMQDRLNTLVATQNPAPRYPNMAALKRDQAAITAGLKFLEDSANRTFTPPIHPDDLANPIEFDWTAPPRTDYETDLPDDELAIRRELVAVRNNGRLIYMDHYLAPYHDLSGAGLDYGQIGDAGSTCLDDTWLLSPESLMGRESALITKLAKLRLGEDAFDAHLAAITARQSTAPNETNATAPRNPKSEIRNPKSNVPTFTDGPPVSPEAFYKLTALRQLERTHLSTFTPALLATDAGSNSGIPTRGR